MQRNSHIASTALVLALGSFSQAISAQAAPELFKPMPLAALHSADDATLQAIHVVPAYHMINRVSADTAALREETREVALTLAPEVQSIVRRTHAQTLLDDSVVWRGTWHGTEANLAAVPSEREWLEASQ